jgi:hypothetical protein
MSTDLRSLFQKIKIDAQTANISYVYYDKETGIIHKISPRKEQTEYEILELDSKEVKPLLTGERKTSDFKIFYDIPNRAVLLKDISNKNIDFLYNKILYEIPKSYYNRADLLIRQNYFTHIWEISINRKTKKFIYKYNLSLDNNILLSITKKNDPNILYRTLRLDLKSLMSDSVCIPFKFDFEFKRQEVSIYTNKYFDSYSYKVIQ